MMNSATPLISIVIPVYNIERFLQRCLDSILAQTYVTFEAILVDDGSTDLSGDICRSYAEKDERIRYIKQENSGPDIARKTGTREAKGDFIAYVDSDDYMAENALEIMINAAMDTDADMVCSQFVRFNEKKVWQGSVFDDKIIVLKDKKEIFEAFFSKGILLGTYVARLIKCDVVKDYEFIRDGLIGEDITAALYMFGNSNCVVVIPDILYYYYYNGNSISHSKYNDRHAVSLENYIRIRNKYLDQDIIDKNRICGYFAGFQMAVATAMGRSGRYEVTVGEKLRCDLKEHWTYIRGDNKTQIYMKGCILMFMVCPRLFVGLYHILYLITGR